MKVSHNNIVGACAIDMERAHLTFLAANEGFVGFNDTAHAPKRCKVSRAHRFTLRCARNQAVLY